MEFGTVPIHLHVKNFNKTKSALAVAAYRTGTKLHDDTHNRTYNFTKKQNIIWNEIMAPDETDETLKNDRERLWNETQDFEKNANARYAKELEFALPRGLTHDQQIEAAERFLKQFVEQKHIVDFALHEPMAKDGLPQPHVHALITSRTINQSGQFEKYKERKVYSLDKNGEKIPLLDQNGEQKIGAKGRKLWKRERIQTNDLDKKENVIEWRKSYCQIVNEYLPQEQQLTPLSYQDRGINKIPTVHEGFTARKIARRGGTSYRIEKNKQIKQLNEQIKKLETEIAELERQEEREKAEKTESEKEKLQKERSDHRAEMAAYDLVKSHGCDMTNWLAVWQASDKLASSDRIDGLYELSQKAMLSYDINDYAKTHDGLKEAKWLQKSLVFYKSGATKLRDTAYDSMTTADKNKVDDELRKRAETEALQQHKQTDQVRFTSAPQRHDNTAYEFKKALNQIDRNLDNTVEKRRAMRDYEAAQRAVEAAQRRMRDDFDM